MPDSISYKRPRLSFFWPFFMVISVFSITALPVAAYDIFYHLRVGTDVFNNLSLSGKDIYSHTGAGTPAQYWEWGFGLLLLSFKNLFGLKWLHLLTGIFGLGACAFLYASCRRRGISPALSTLLAVAFALSVRYRMFARPHIATFLLCTALLYFMEANRKRPAYLHALWIFFIMVFWSAMHQGAVFGLIILFCYLCEGLIELLPQKLPIEKSENPGKNLATIAAGFTAAILGFAIMPGASAKLDFIFGVLQNKSTHVHQLAEYRPLNPLEHPFWMILLTASILLAVMNRKNLRPALLAWMLGFGLLSFLHSRTAGVAAVAMVGLIAHHAKAIADRNEISIQTPAGGRIPIYIGLLIFAVTLFVSTFHFKSWPIGKIKYDAFPEKALAFADKLGLSGPLFNSYHFGNYLTYHFDPRRPVFWDARDWAYRKLYERIKTESPAQIFEDYKISWALVDNSQFLKDTPIFPVTDILMDATRWRVIYFDDVATVLVRLDGPDSGATDQYGLQAMVPWRTGFEYLGGQINDPQVRGLVEKEIARSKTQMPGPMQQIWEGSFLAMTGDFNSAKALYQQSAQAMPESPLPREKLGELLLRSNQCNLAMEQLHDAVKLAPKNPNTRFLVGYGELKCGRPCDANRHFRKAIAKKPGWATAHFNQGLAYLDCGKPGKAKASFERVISIQPKGSLAEESRDYLAQIGR